MRRYVVVLVTDSSLQTGAPSPAQKKASGPGCSQLRVRVVMRHAGSIARDSSALRGVETLDDDLGLVRRVEEN